MRQLRVIDRSVAVAPGLHRGTAQLMLSLCGVFPLLRTPLPLHVEGH